MCRHALLPDGAEGISSQPQAYMGSAPLWQTSQNCSSKGNGPLLMMCSINDMPGFHSINLPVTYQALAGCRHTMLHRRAVTDSIAAL